jgi:pyrroline-5-carboxylate reductase
MLADWLEDMACCGLLDKLEEHQMDAASALSGSGPAYLYLLLDAMADGAVACGLPREKALRYGAMTMAGAAKMYLETGTHPGALKDAVCSPGGSTIAGIRQLEDKGCRSMMMECILAAHRRNLELGK